MGKLDDLDGLQRTTPTGDEIPIYVSSEVDSSVSTVEVYPPLSVGLANEEALAIHRRDPRLVRLPIRPEDLGHIERTLGIFRYRAGALLKKAKARAALKSLPRTVKIEPEDSTIATQPVRVQREDAPDPDKTKPEREGAKR